MDAGKREATVSPKNNSERPNARWKDRQDGETCEMERQREGQDTESKMENLHSRETESEMERQAIWRERQDGETRVEETKDMFFYFLNFLHFAVFTQSSV